MGGSAIRGTAMLEWRFTVPTDVALERINACFTEDQVLAWREPVREQLRQRAPLSEVASVIGLEPECVAPGTGDAFHLWLDEDWTPAGARRLRALLRLVTAFPGTVTFDWRSCSNWEEFELQAQRRPGTADREVLVTTPHP